MTAKERLKLKASMIGYQICVRRDISSVFCFTREEWMDDIVVHNQQLRRVTILLYVGNCPTPEEIGNIPPDLVPHFQPSRSFSDDDPCWDQASRFLDVLISKGKLVAL